MPRCRREALQKRAAVACVPARVWGQERRGAHAVRAWRCAAVYGAGSQQCAGGGGRGSSRSLRWSRLRAPSSTHPGGRGSRAAARHGIRRISVLEGRAGWAVPASALTRPARAERRATLKLGALCSSLRALSAERSLACGWRARAGYLRAGRFERCRKPGRQGHSRRGSRASRLRPSARGWARAQRARVRLRELRPLLRAAGAGTAVATRPAAWPPSAGVPVAARCGCAPSRRARRGGSAAAAAR